MIGLTAAQISEQQNIKQGLKARFVYVTNLSELEQQLAIAKQNNQAVMLDFYADWCVACKDFEKATFTDEGVIEQLENVVLIQADVTKNNADDQAMLSKLDILGLPSILFYNQQGERLTQARVTGFMAGEQFLQHLQRFEIK